MPYIKTEDRARFVRMLDNIDTIANKGELEYLVFCLMKKYMLARKYKYTELHDCVYAVQHCADEFRRRFLDKREDVALKENGDILLSEIATEVSDNSIAAEELARDIHLSVPKATEE